MCNEIHFPIYIWLHMCYMFITSCWLHVLNTIYICIVYSLDGLTFRPFQNTAQNIEQWKIEKRGQRGRRDSDLNPAVKANCSTAGHVLTTPPTILWTAVVKLTLPLGLRLVPAAAVQWQADIVFSPPAHFDGRLYSKPLEKKKNFINVRGTNKGAAPLIGSQKEKYLHHLLE